MFNNLKSLFTKCMIPSLACLALLTIGCGEPTSNDQSNNGPSNLCRVNSDCAYNQICQEGVCAEVSLVITECDEEGCACSNDQQCPERTYCDLQSNRCSLIECSLNSDCDIGLVCISRRCVTDLEADQDRDGVPDNVDNCPQVINPNQANTDLSAEGTPAGPLQGDELGDLCDEDKDNDGVLNEVDNCELIYNPNQRDRDEDSIGDRCEPTFQGVCGDCAVDRVEGGTIYCDESCGLTPRCEPGRAQCNDNIRELCNQRGEWDQRLCGGAENCVEVNDFETRCESRVCLPEQLSCGEESRSIERCDELGRAWEVLTLCEEGTRCIDREGEFSCEPTICIPEERRCNGEQLQRCARGLLWLNETCPSRFTCGLVDNVSSCVQTSCGNGLLEAGEQCDDGNLITEDCPYGERECNVCNATCEVELGDTRYCGDGLLDPSEACDDGNNETEECDYGLSSCQVCNDQCQLEEGVTHFCGDEVVDDTEECDRGGLDEATCPYGVRCTLCDERCELVLGYTPRCGDGIVQAQEECDDGELQSAVCEYGTGGCTLCSSQCSYEAGTPQFCGDGIINGGEECDDGNALTEGCEYNGGDSCFICDSECRVVEGSPQRCGDGIIQVEFEQCDDGGRETGDGCDDQCLTERCGNGVTQGGLGEECDDGNRVSGDGCDASCRLECGDGVKSSTEECDDGNREAGDGCDPLCREEFCGNGLIEEINGEECDDGGRLIADGCDESCLIEACGNGILQYGEACDDGNTEPGDGCSPSCEIDCGDGVVGVGEECDDGNLLNGDGCDNACFIERCGNGRVDTYEACDDGNLSSGDGCSITCLIETCGDGIVNTNFGEECDDANELLGDGCGHCLIEDCGNGRREFNEICDAQEESCTSSCTPRPCFELGCPELDLVYIAGGRLNTGHPFGGLDANEQVWPSELTPERSFRLASFRLMRGEVTRGMYRACVDAGVCSSPGGDFDDLSLDDLPVVYVSWPMANTFATWMGMRLPSTLEWEYAARDNGRFEHYPWGDLPLRDEEGQCRANLSGCGYEPVLEPCSLSQDATSAGICDLIGNVSEWTSSINLGSYHHYDDQGVSRSPDIGPLYSGGFIPPIFKGVTARALEFGTSAAYKSNSLGFRLAANISAREEASLNRCGDGLLDDELGERCDDGNEITERCEYGQRFCMVCDQYCQLSAGESHFCGDAVIQAERGEECDVGLDLVEQCPLGEASCLLCNTDCVYEMRNGAICGDGVIEGLESCEDGNVEPGDGCDANCAQEYCGNGVAQPHLGESCDDGNRVSGDGCDAFCYDEVGVCGDGVVALYEECDDAAQGGPPCERCHRLVCGNGVVQSGEECDDGGRINGDGCSQDCTFETCGDGVVSTRLGERCDDGNQQSGDGCDVTCQRECGNGRLDPSEGCDDGNRAQGDGCDHQCRPERCGDGVLQWNESCDDGNRTEGDGCDLRCQLESCGDGVIDTTEGEECDDANGDGGDDCHLCRLTYCGDGLLRRGLELDDPAYEECDDGDDSDPSDGCHQCRRPSCGDHALQRDLTWLNELGERVTYHEQCDGGEECDQDCTLSIPCEDRDQCPQIVWQFIEGGSLTVEQEGETAVINIPSFEMSQTEVTVAQYRRCVDVGECEAPPYGNFVAYREQHPVNLLDWNQSRRFAKWVGADLPTRAQWLFAATSRGQRLSLPDVDDFCEYGDVSTSNNSTAARNSCNGLGTSPVCFYPKDTTDQGLCDLNGNVRERLLDDSRGAFEGYAVLPMPLDGSAACQREDCSKPSSGSRKAYGGRYYASTPIAAYTQGSPTQAGYSMGIRLVRPVTAWTVQAPRSLNLP